MLVWFKTSLSSLLELMRSRNIYVRRSFIVLFALTGAATLGGAAFYLKRKRRKNQPDKPPQFSLKDNQLRNPQDAYYRKSEGYVSRKRMTSVSSTTVASSIASSSRTRNSRYVTSSEDTSKALYKEGVEEFKSALDKINQATSMMEDSMTNLSGDLEEQESSTTLVRDNSVETLRDFDASSSCRSSQVGSSLISSASHHHSTVPNHGDGSEIQSNFPQERATLNKLQQQLQSIVARMDQLPFKLDDDDFDDDTLTQITDGGRGEGRERRESNTFTDDTESNSSYFSARDVWEIRSTDFAMKSQPSSRLQLYEEGLRAMERGEVPLRVVRTERVQCHSEQEYIAKLYCLRIAFTEVTRDDAARRWMEESGRLMMESILCAANRDCDAFNNSYQQLVQFCRLPANHPTIEEEILAKKVPQLTFYDIVIDYILMDAFENLENPPNALSALIQNRWLYDSFKEKAITSLVWSILKGKRKTLLRSNGFFAHLYDVSAFVSPDLAWGFFGPLTPLQKACFRFKEEIIELLTSIFNFRRVRYTNKEQMSEDLIKVMRERFKSFITYMNEKVLSDPEALNIMAR